MHPLVSVSIPVYNAAKFLPRCLESIRRQTYTNWEAVCVDDGSTDESGAILEAVAKIDSRFKVIHQANRGASCARQTALEASLGEWIASIDADDWIDENFLKNLIAETNDSVDFIWSDYQIDYEDGEATGVSNERDEGDYEQYAVGLFNGKHFGAQWNKLIRREFIERYDIHHPLERVPVCEDLWFTAAVLEKRPRIAFANHSDYHYFIRRGSALRSPYTYERFAGFVRVQAFLESLDLPKLAKDLIVLRRREIKATAYRQPVVPDKAFYSLYPEIRDLRGFDCPVWHKVLFWFAVRGFRSVINIIWRIIDK